MARFDWNNIYIDESVRVIPNKRTQNKMNKIQDLNTEMVQLAYEDTRTAHIKADEILVKALEYLAEEAGYREDAELLISNYNNLHKEYA